MEDIKYIEENTSFKKKYREVKCFKCGTTYPSLYKECPECGFSLVRKLLKVGAIVFLALALISSSIFLFIKEKRIEDRVSEIESTIQSLSSSSIDLESLDYYQTNLIYDGANLDAFGSDFLIYALQDGCSACATANEYIYMYLYYGYPDYLPIYFITPESASSIFFDTLSCESTPTLYRMNGKDIIEKEEGVDKVYNMLDEITTEANTKGE